MLQVIFDAIAGLLEAAWQQQKKKFEKKVDDGSTETSHA
jgi:hypothetical protein